MVRVPLPQQTQQAGGRGGLSAPGVVPVADQTGPQLQQLGAALQSSGFQAADAFADMQERLHIANVKQGQARAEEVIQNHNEGFFSLTGKPATGEGRKKAWEALTKEVQGLEQGLEHDVERRLFRDQVGRRLLQTRGSWGSHELRQTQVYEIGEGKALLERKKQAAIAEGMGVGQRHSTASGMLRAARAEARSVAAKLSYGPEQTALFVQQHAAEVHAERINQALKRGAVGVAREYLSNVQDRDMPQQVRSQLQRLVESGSVAEESAALASGLARDLAAEHLASQVREPSADAFAGPGATAADEVFARPLTAGAFQDQALQRIQSMQDAGEISPDVAKGARSEILRMSGEQNNREKAETAGVRSEGEKYLLDNRHRFANTDTMRRERPDLWLRARDLGVLDDLNTFANNDNNYPTNPLVWALTSKPRMGGAADITPQAFDALFAPQLSRDDFKEIKALYNEMNGLESPEGDPQLPDRVRKEMLRRADLEDDDTGAAWNLEKNVRARIKQREVEKAGKLTVNEKAEEAFTEVFDVVQRDGFFGFSDVRVSELTDKEREQIEGKAGPGSATIAVTGDRLEEEYRRTINPEGPLPVWLKAVGPVFARTIPELVRGEILKTLRAQRRPETEAGLVLLWLRAGRPKTMQEAIDNEAARVARETALVQEPPRAAADLTPEEVDFRAELEEQITKFGLLR